MKKIILLCLISSLLFASIECQINNLRKLTNTQITDEQALELVASTLQLRFEISEQKFMAQDKYRDLTNMNRQVLSWTLNQENIEYIKEMAAMVISDKQGMEKIIQEKQIKINNNLQQISSFAQQLKQEIEVIKNSILELEQSKNEQNNEEVQSQINIKTALNEKKKLISLIISNNF